MNILQTLKRIFTKRKFLKFRTSKNRLRKVSKLPHTKNIKFLCFNSVQNISDQKNNFNFWKFCFLVKSAFRALRKHFYNPRAHFFKLKFVKFSKSWKWLRNCFKSCPAVNVSFTTERNRIKCLIWKTIFINFKNFHLEQWNKSCPAVNVVAQVKF